MESGRVALAGLLGRCAAMERLKRELAQLGPSGLQAGDQMAVEELRPSGAPRAISAAWVGRSDRGRVDDEARGVHGA